MGHNYLKIQEQIRFLQMETGTACNYKCIYCPVAYFPRKGKFLPLELIDKVVTELESFPNLEKIYLNGYDEPTLNPRLVDIINKLVNLPSKIVLFTNGTNLTPDLVQKIVQTKAQIELDIHLSAINTNDFEHIHQSKLLNKVMKNLRFIIENYLQLSGVNICISMQALENEIDNYRFYELQQYFTDTPLLTFRWKPNDRAGLLSGTPYALNQKHKCLKGCSLDQRTRDWIHINATGNVILCCQDYFESHIIGNISENSLTEILASKQRSIYNQWTMGEVEAPDDYICRRCVFAITPDNNFSNDSH